MRAFTHAALVAALLATALPALAAPPGGGIVLGNAAGVRTAAEDVYVSPASVRVRYTLENITPKDIDAVLRFPLPDLDNPSLAVGGNGLPEHASPPNFVGFTIKVDGKPITAVVEEHAVLDGKDVTAELKAAGVPLSLFYADFDERLAKLPKALRAKLVKDGLIAALGNEAAASAGDNFPATQANWTTRTAFSWHQHFASHKSVTIELAYKPLVQASGVSSAEPEAGAEIQYCADAALKAGVALAAKKSPDNYAVTLVGFALAGQAHGPIGKFHLTIDKLKPENFVSLCWAGGLKKTGATTQEATLLNFLPQHDVQIEVFAVP